MKKILGAAVAAIALVCAGSASAKTVRVIAIGYLERELNLSGGPDPNLKLGDRVVLRAMFDDSRLVRDDDYDFYYAALYGLPTTGKEYWRIDAGGMTWSSRNDVQDGEYGDPGVGILNGKLSYLGVDAYDWGTPHIRSSYGDTFQVLSPNGAYGYDYETQGFLGRWHYRALVSGVPEPTTWAMMIVGFGLAGGALRRRNQLAAA